MIHGSLVPVAGDGGVVTFHANSTGKTTEAYLQGYEDGTYYSNFTI